MKKAFLTLALFLMAQMPNAALAQTDPEKSPFSAHTLSVFGTAGYAQSNQPFAYNRVSESGTWDSVSRIGAQWEVALTPRLSFTLQGEFAPSLSDDHRWRPQLTWAILSYCPMDHWLLRVGRIRLPTFLHTQNSNVGMSYIPARLPIEVYGLSPTYDFNGIFSTYTWNLENGMQTLAWVFTRGFPTRGSAYGFGILTPAPLPKAPIIISAKWMSSAPI